jgi:hypothetical protein
MAMTRAKTKEEWVSRQRFADVIGVDVRMIADYRKRADFPVRVRGRDISIPLERAVQWYIEFKVTDELRRRAAESDAGDRPLTPAQRKDLADAKKKELELEQMLGNSIDRADAVREVGRYQERVRAVVGALPGRYADERFVNLNTVGRVLQELKRLATGVLRDLIVDAEAFATEPDPVEESAA